MGLGRQYVADRTNPSDRVNLEVARAVRDQLNDYKAALQGDLGRRASQGEILSALLSGVPLWQARAMLDAYRPQDNPGSTGGQDE
jgi:hypothetical protein